LGAQPSHLKALKLAAEAADKAGDPIRAHGYRQLYEGLSWNRAKNLIDSASPGPPPPPANPPEPPRQAVPLREASSDEPDLVWQTERSEISLADVAGMDAVKRRLNLAFLAPLRNPDMMKLYKRSLKGGLLLYGPPGCGKTFIARAVAGELGARFLSVGLSDVLDMWLGQSERNLHEIFETARRNRPCVLFFDEIDALGRKRSLMRHSAGRDVVNQLLAELDSVEADNEGLFTIAATNHPWDVDTALRRPGRLDRTLLVTPPDSAAREQILRANLEGRPVKDLDLGSIAARTDGFSGADMVHLVESATELAMEAALSAGTARPITMADFKATLKEIKPSARTWFDTAKNYALFANEGGAYDELVEYLRANRLL
ncbi:MAG TPA: ATP-binding protein, partial [Capsulimonadaceae bacterium]|nr:ATP-binding protein [Capsulimonadaceae bacterium]